ncbi:hypothetical protein [Desulfogranum mediterraneum]|uniref:hypothetical protein n=1 Tax=Desulfogranum mediterraneum TaxID=160661 RepID=UPI0003F68F91|nr:hypothetical protein [Desulfogranum mediterraneum]
MKKSSVTCVLIAMLMASLFAVSGCTANKSAVAASTEGVSPDTLPPVPGFAGDIQDIVLPPELEWDRANSMGIKTESFRGGVYVYKGDVSVMSLKDYMVQSMQDNKWKQVGETSSKDVMLAFVKPNKTCMMVISEGGLVAKTSLTFYVTIDATAATALNPFGEAISQ